MGLRALKAQYLSLVIYEKLRPNSGSKEEGHSLLWLEIIWPINLLDLAKRLLILERCIRGANLINKFQGRCLRLLCFFGKLINQLYFSLRPTNNKWCTNRAKSAVDGYTTNPFSQLHFTLLKKIIIGNGPLSSGISTALYRSVYIK